jgi:uncharacterized protein YjbJ (UPF0337 family)
MSPLIQ